jgi:hypothetical protein
MPQPHTGPTVMIERQWPLANLPRAPIGAPPGSCLPGFPIVAGHNLGQGGDSESELNGEPESLGL